MISHCKIIDNPDVFHKTTAHRLSVSRNFNFVKIYEGGNQSIISAEFSLGALDRGYSTKSSSEEFRKTHRKICMCWMLFTAFLWNICEWLFLFLLGL